MPNFRILSISLCIYIDDIIPNLGMFQKIVKALRDDLFGKFGTLFTALSCILINKLNIFHHYCSFIYVQIHIGKHFALVGHFACVFMHTGKVSLMFDMFQKTNA